MLPKLICCALIALGGGFLAVAVLSGQKLMALAKKHKVPFSDRGILVSLLLLCAIMVGYVVAFVLVCTQPVVPAHLAISVVLCLNGVVIKRLFTRQSYMANYLQERNKELHDAVITIEQNNQTLKREVDIRVDEVMHQDKLLHTVNDVATLLLGSAVDSFGNTLYQCMEMVGESADVDRVYIWQNHMEGDELYCTQVYEWSGGAEPMQDTELTVSVAFPDNWYPNLSQNLCINSPVSAFTGFERDHLMAQGIVSILVVPVYIEGEFWGFVGFDDCESERFFSDAAEAILRSVSLLFATAFMRNQMTENLMKAKEAALSSARAKTDFLANMSHEIRTPINAITGMSSIARAATEKSRVDECLDKIDAASRQLLGLINDVLDMSKIEAGKLTLSSEPFRLREVLNDVGGMIAVRAAEKKQSFALELDHNLPEVVVGDDMRLSQVLLNLLSNAVKFTPEGGRIQLEVNCIESDDANDKVEFTVSDSGIGIAPQQLSRLFSKFEQADGGTSRRFGGTGLGLSISKSLIDMMDGSIQVESTPGQGSSFSVCVALQRGSESMLQPADGSKEASAAAYDFSGRHVLLVEDIEINREIVIALLEDTGIEVTEAENGQQAVELFAEAPALYDLIFMDIHMPVMDGYAATRQLRGLDVAEASRIPIIAMTANAFTEDVERCLSVGMNDHIAKPIDFDVLMGKMQHYLNPDAEKDNKASTN